MTVAIPEYLESLNAVYLGTLDPKGIGAWGGGRKMAKKTRRERGEKPDATARGWRGTAERVENEGELPKTVIPIPDAKPQKTQFRVVS